MHGPGRLPSGYTTSCPVLLLLPQAMNGIAIALGKLQTSMGFAVVLSLSACGYYHIHLQVQAVEVSERERVCKRESESYLSLINAWPVERYLSCCLKLFLKSTILAMDCLRICEDKEEPFD